MATESRRPNPASFRVSSGLRYEPLGRCRCLMLMGAKRSVVDSRKHPAVDARQRAVRFDHNGSAPAIAVDGVVALREAITAANTNAPVGDAPAGDPGNDTITFDIPGSGPHVITPLSPLPVITDTLTIDGTSEPARRT